VPNKEEASTEIVSFKVDDMVLFTPYDGNNQKAKIVGLPPEGSSKYMCLLNDGQQVPINPCYLRKL
jgi:hypothetical protein